MSFTHRVVLKKKKTIDQFTSYIIKLYAYLLNKGCFWQPESLSEVCLTFQQLMQANVIPSIVLVKFVSYRLKE